MNLNDFKQFIIKNHKDDYDEYMKSLENTKERERISVKIIDRQNSKTLINPKLSLEFKFLLREDRYIVGLQDNSYDCYGLSITADYYSSQGDIYGPEVAGKSQTGHSHSWSGWRTSLFPFVIEYKE